MDISDCVLRLFSHSTSRNPVPVATPQQARVVYAGLPFQSLHPDDRRYASCHIIFHSSKPLSASFIPDPPDLMHRDLTEL